MDRVGKLINYILSHKPSRKSFTFYTLTFALFFSLGISLRAGEKNTQLLGMAQTSPPQLYFTPSAGQVKVNQILPLKVYLKSTSQVASSAEMLVLFDPSLAELKAGPLPGPAFTHSTSSLATGRAGLIRWSSYGEFKGANYVLSFTLLPKQKGELKINLDHAAVNGQRISAQPAIFQIK